VFSLSKTFFIAILFTGFTAGAQEIVVPLPYGNMDEWITRQVKESFVIGGKIQAADSGLITLAWFMIKNNHKPFFN
jgi:hypothetical protein